jgi:DNA-binding transcriptional ArsR family regulator
VCVNRRHVLAMPKKSRQLTDEALVMIARRFGALSEPMRLRLLHSLFDGEKNVNTLVQLSGGTQTNVSRHLQTLTDAGMLARRKDGLQVFYSIADPSIFELCELVCSSLEKQHSARVDALTARR